MMRWVKCCGMCKHMCKCSPAGPQDSHSRCNARMSRALQLVLTQRSTSIIVWYFLRPCHHYRSLLLHSSHHTMSNRQQPSLELITGHGMCKQVMKPSAEAHKQLVLTNNIRCTLLAAGSLGVCYSAACTAPEQQHHRRACCAHMVRHCGRCSLCNR